MKESIMNLKSLDKNALYRLIVVLGGIVLITWGCLLVLMPFIPAIIWAVILCLSAWPAFLWLQKKFNGHDALSALVMTLALTMGFLAPLIILGSSLVENFETIKNLIMETVSTHRDVPPGWLTALPWIGPYAGNAWSEYAGDTDKMIATLQNYADPASGFLLGLGATIGRGIFDIALGILIAFFFFLHGEKVASRLQILIDRFAGEYGHRLLNVSKNTMTGVVYGILGAALAQGAVAGIAFWIAGIPGAALLGFFTIVLSFVPMGPPLIWFPAAVWLFSDDQTGMGIFMLFGGFVISSIDNFIRPYFISLGSSMPLLLVLLGVFGGIFAFGFIGIFIGPVLLVLAYSLISEWSQSDVLVSLPRNTPQPASNSDLNA